MVLAYHCDVICKSCSAFCLQPGGAGLAVGVPGRCHRSWYLAGIISCVLGTFKLQQGCQPLSVSPSVKMFLSTTLLFALHSTDATIVTQRASPVTAYLEPYIFSYCAVTSPESLGVDTKMCQKILQMPLHLGHPEYGVPSVTTFASCL